VGPRAVLDTVVKRKIPSPRRESNPRTSLIQPIAQRYTDSAINGYLIIVNSNKNSHTDIYCSFKNFWDRRHVSNLAVLRSL
jgi:hypothetical protein